MFKVVFILIFLIISSSKTLAKEIKGFPKVTDGDTIKINNNKIRLHGIDAPELAQMCNKLKKKYSCGLISSKALSKKINKNLVICRVQIRQDRYGRFIGTCYLKNLNLNKWMVQNGHAIAYRRYSQEYIKYEEFAKKNSLGIWSGTFIEPEKWRKLY